MCNDPNWTIPFFSLKNIRLPDGRYQLVVLGGPADVGQLESYLGRFGFAPAEHSGQKKLIRPKGKGWEILDLDACPELAGARQELVDPENAKEALLKCDWQLVGYTINRHLIKLLFDPSGEGFWQIAEWGFRDISPDLKEGYFDFTLNGHTLYVEWVDSKARSTFKIAVAKTINVCSTGHGALAFFDHEITVDRHIVPPEISDLNGWPLIYWGTEDTKGKEFVA
jgi:hypothetical protein